MTTPLSELRRAVRRVLTEELRPIHYGELTRLALERIGTTAERREFSKVKEDVREKVLLAGTDGLAYTGAPHYFGVVREWFSQRPLLAVDHQVLDTSVDIAIEAGVTTALRLPHMLNKYGLSDEERASMAMRGFLLEVTVSRWFRHHWPQLWRQPDNAYRYRDACGHDFKLEMPLSGLRTFDVAGAGWDGDFGAVRNKPAADYHLLARRVDEAVHLEGFCSGPEFAARRLGSVQAWPITRLLVWINCECAGVRMRDLAAALGLVKVPA